MSRPAALLLVAVMLLRGLLPAGFMPDRAVDPDGGFELVICHAGLDGASPQPVQQNGRQPVAPAKAGCDFALLAQAFLISKVAGVALPDRIAIAVLDGLAGVALTGKGAVRGGWARAPPMAA